MKMILYFFLIVLSSASYADSLSDADDAFHISNYAKAYKIYSENIDTSYYSRMMQAYMLANGLGVKQDYKVAFELMEDVANVNPQAQLHLAVMYANGLGVEKSYDKANLYLKKAKINGEYWAEMYLNDLYGGRELNFIKPKLSYLVQSYTYTTGGGYEPIPSDTRPTEVKAQNIDFSIAKKQCNSLGFKAGTEKFGKCVLELTK